MKKTYQIITEVDLHRESLKLKELISIAKWYKIFSHAGFVYFPRIDEWLYSSSVKVNQIPSIFLSSVSPNISTFCWHWFILVKHYENELQRWIELLGTLQTHVFIWKKKFFISKRDHALSFSSFQQNGLIFYINSSSWRWFKLSVFIWNLKLTFYRMHAKPAHKKLEINAPK